MTDQVTEDTATISWDRVQALIDRYMVNYTSLDGDTEEMEVGRNETTTTLTGLKPGIEYVIFLWAEKGTWQSKRISTEAVTGIPENLCASTWHCVAEVISLLSCFLLTCCRAYTRHQFVLCWCWCCLSLASFSLPHCTQCRRGLQGCAYSQVTGLMNLCWGCVRPKFLWTLNFSWTFFCTIILPCISVRYFIPEASVWTWLCLSDLSCLIPVLHCQ